MKDAPIELIYGMLAVAGGIARYLNGYVVGGEKFKFTILLASAFVAGFSGFMFALIGESLDLPVVMTHIMAGIGGFFGEQTLKLVFEIVQKKIK